MKLSILFMSLALVACQKNDAPAEKQFSDEMKVRIEKSIQRDDITGRVNLFFKSLDNQDFAKAREILADNVEYDLGEGSSNKSADEIIEALKSSTAGLEGVQHSLTNYGFQLNESGAKLNIVATITHYKKLKSGKNTRVHYGTYELDFLQPANEKEFWAWKISKLKYVNKFTDGNVKLK